jgi:hypothetical protein
MRRRPALLLAVAVAATATTTALAASAPPRGPVPSVVVAVADTGVNPYHSLYYRPQNTAHPCTWVKGFTDCSIPALNLSIGKHKDYQAAVEADADTWAGVRPGQWYWIPRTNIIGAVCDTARGGRSTSVVVPDATCILDDDGHGTGTTSSVLTEAPDALLLVHDGKATATHLATAPVVPDVQSHSWGPPAPLPLQAADAATGAGFCDRGTRRVESVFFLAAGNEAPFPTIGECERHHLDVHVVGGSYPGYWNYNSWTTYDFASWMCRPVALHDSTKDWQERTCGTSFAAPTAAGAAAAALLRVRQNDGYAGRSTAARVSSSVTRQQFDTALRDGATYTPKAKYTTPGPSCTYVVCYVGWAPLPAQAPYMFWGYGWLDGTVTDAVVGCALGRTCAAKSAEAQQYNGMRQNLRATFGTRYEPTVTQQDAGTSRDAGADRRSAIQIAAGKGYTSRLDTFALGGDEVDGYVVPVRAGQRISVRSTSSAHPALPSDTPTSAGCWWVIAPDGQRVDAGSPGMRVYADGCSATTAAEHPQDVVAEESGRYLLLYGARDGAPPHEYRFTVTLSR